MWREVLRTSVQVWPFENMAPGSPSLLKPFLNKAEMELIWIAQELRSDGNSNYYMLHPSLVDKNFHFYSIDLEGFQNQKSILPAHFPSTCQQSCRIFLLLWTFLQKCLFPICMHLQQWAVETLAQEENFWAIDLFSSTRWRLVNLALLLSKTWFHSALYQD